MTAAVRSTVSAPPASRIPAAGASLLPCFLALRSLLANVRPVASLLAPHPPLPVATKTAQPGYFFPALVGSPAAASRSDSSDGLPTLGPAGVSSPFPTSRSPEIRSAALKGAQHIQRVPAPALDRVEPSICLGILPRSQNICVRFPRLSASHSAPPLPLRLPPLLWLADPAPRAVRESEDCRTPIEVESIELAQIPEARRFPLRPCSRNCPSAIHSDFHHRFHT